MPNRPLDFIRRQPLTVFKDVLDMRVEDVVYYFKKIIQQDKL